jgi:16S rRNA (cytosine967-C5)-methyltransferase
VLGRPLDEALARTADALPPRDRALALALASGVLRRLPDLDALLDALTARPLPADARARQVLRVALFGLLALETPVHAVLATALPLLEGGPRRLAHAVIGRAAREGLRLPASPTLPEPWAARWRAVWGEAVVAGAAAAMGETPPTDLALRDPARTGEWAERLGGRSLAPGHLRLAGSHRVDALPGFAEGDWWVQDWAAQQPVAWLGPVAGRRVLDLCAAPGGKTMQLAAAGALVTAVDRDARRLAVLEANLKRTRLAATIVAADALEWAPAEPFDAILLDAPCSATGIFRRHPEVLHRRDPAALPALAAAQVALLERAAGAGWLAPGGTLVYAVCSMEREEGEEVIEAAATGLARDLATRLFPASDAGDGFFLARFRRP